MGDELLGPRTSRRSGGSVRESTGPRPNGSTTRRRARVGRRRAARPHGRRPDRVPDDRGRRPHRLRRARRRGAAPLPYARGTPRSGERRPRVADPPRRARRAVPAPARADQPSRTGALVCTTRTCSCTAGTSRSRPARTRRSGRTPPRSRSTRCARRRRSPTSCGAGRLLGRRTVGRYCGRRGRPAAGVLGSHAAGSRDERDVRPGARRRPRRRGQRVARRLRDRGADVYTPTLTGFGERSHLDVTAVTFETFVTDVVNVFRFEDLHDVVLVGHSMGGVIIPRSRRSSRTASGESSGSPARSRPTASR